jgi:hypothetical protein
MFTNSTNTLIKLNMITLWFLMGMEMFKHGDIEHHISLNSYEVTTCNGFEIIDVIFNQNTQNKSMLSV